MNSTKALNIILGLALLILVTKAQISLPTKGGNTMANSSEIILNNIHQRKSVRTFTDKAITKEQIEVLLKAGMAAPTAANKQPWEFIVVTKRELLDSLAEKLPYAKMLKAAPAAIVVAGNLEKSLPGIEADYWVQDCSAASENILLAVEALKLGAVWTGVHPMPERVEAVKSILNIPEKIIPLNVIAIGYSKGNPPAKNKWNPKAVHLEAWTEK